MTNPVQIPAPDTCSRAGGCTITGIVEIDCHRWYAVVKIAGEVIGVVGHTVDGLCLFDSVDEFMESES